MGGEDKKIKKQIRNKQRRKVRYEALEPRVLLSADFLPVDLGEQTPSLVDELIVDVDLDQVEETSRFIIEGLESVTVPETLVAEAEPTDQSNDTEAASADNSEATTENTEISVAAPSEQLQPLMQQYWLDKLSANSQPVVAAVDVIQEVIVVDSSINNYESLIDDLLANYRNSHSLVADGETTSADTLAAPNSHFLSDQT